MHYTGWIPDHDPLHNINYPFTKIASWYSFFWILNHRGWYIQCFVVAERSCALDSRSEKCIPISRVWVQIPVLSLVSLKQHAGTLNYYCFILGIGLNVKPYMMCIVGPMCYKQFRTLTTMLSLIQPEHWAVLLADVGSTLTVDKCTRSR